MYHYPHFVSLSGKTMSEYQYYEFCSINKPLSKIASDEMNALSSRAKVGSHNACYVYNYGDFRGDPQKLLLKYFDMFFYISNFGTIQLMFKYHCDDINLDQIQQFSRKHVVELNRFDQDVVLHINVNNEEGFGWTEGEGLLPELLPIYTEIQQGDYQALKLTLAIDDTFSGMNIEAVNHLRNESEFSAATHTFLECVGV